MSTCPTSQKKSFTSRTAAQKQLSKAWKTMRGGKLPRRSYRCQCGMWHVTSRP